MLAGLFLHGTSCSWTAAARALTRSPTAAFPPCVWHAEPGKSPPAPWRQAWCGEGSRCHMWWESPESVRGGGGWCCCSAEIAACLGAALSEGAALGSSQPGGSGRRSPVCSELTGPHTPPGTAAPLGRSGFERGAGSACARHPRMRVLPTAPSAARLLARCRPPWRDFRFPLLRSPPPARARQPGEAEAAAGPRRAGLSPSASP